MWLFVVSLYLEYLKKGRIYFVFFNACQKVVLCWYFRWCFWCLEVKTLNTFLLRLMFLMSQGQDPQSFLLTLIFATLLSIACPLTHIILVVYLAMSSNLSSWNAIFQLLICKICSLFDVDVRLRMQQEVLFNVCLFFHAHPTCTLFSLFLGLFPTSYLLS